MDHCSKPQENLEENCYGTASYSATGAGFGGAGLFGAEASEAAIMAAVAPRRRGRLAGIGGGSATR
jgi:hypothetical protein